MAAPPPPISSSADRVARSRTEANPASVRFRSPVSDPGHLDRNLADSGHDFPLREEAVTNQAPAALLVKKMRMFGNERGNLGLNGGTQEFAPAGLDDIGQRIG